MRFSPNELFAAAAENEAVGNLVESFTQDLALIISSLQAAFDMEIVVIGGGVSESADFWWQNLMDQVEPLLLNPLEIKVAQFENDAGILGAALLVLENQ